MPRDASAAPGVAVRRVALTWNGVGPTLLPTIGNLRQSRGLPPGGPAARRVRQAERRVWHSGRVVEGIYDNGNVGSSGRLAGWRALGVDLSISEIF